MILIRNNIPCSCILWIVGSFPIPGHSRTYPGPTASAQLRDPPSDPMRQIRAGSCDVGISDPHRFLA